jgi:hypothetical protein
MSSKPADDLESFPTRQDPSTLVDVLIELANEHKGVQARLARLQPADRPDKLAAGFRKTLAARRRSSKFLSYRESGEFDRTLKAWPDQVDRELLPKKLPPRWHSSSRSSKPTAPSSNALTTPTATSATWCAVRTACRHWPTCPLGSMKRSQQ